MFKLSLIAIEVRFCDNIIIKLLSFPASLVLCVEFLRAIKRNNHGSILKFY